MSLLPGDFVNVSVGPEPVVVYPLSGVVVVVVAEADAAVEAVAGFRWVVVGVVWWGFPPVGCGCGV